MPMKSHVTIAYNAPFIVGIDIAKHKHVAAVLEGRASKPFAIPNTREGFDAFEAWLDRQAAGRPVVLGMEPTGHYGKPLEEWLLARGYELRMVPGVLTKRAKDLLDGLPLKTDEKDARVIAELVRQNIGRAVRPDSAAFETLRYLAELHRRLGEERASLLNRLHRLLDLLFPELPRFFCELNCATALALLEVAPTPKDVLSLGLDGLIALLTKAGRGRRCQSKAEAILEAARKSIGCSRGAEALRLDLELLLPRLRALNAQRRLVEDRMRQALRQVEYAERLLTIPGLGEVTLAALLGELGDLRNYRHTKQLVKMAGLTLVENSSGARHGRKRIAKRGRPLLRKLLYLAAIRMFAKNLPLHGLHNKHSGNKAGSQVAVAGMRRLLAAMFGIVRDGVSFSQEKFEVRPAATPSMKLVA